MCNFEVIVEEKSDEQSDKFREEGNKEYRDKEKDGKLISALWLYNKALCYAESKEKMALAFANRSMVYFALRKYEECLQNIKWAREHEYPETKVSKLDEREADCIEELKKVIYDPDEDPMNYFKLSHPPNPKIPFIADCLEYRKSNGGVYATCDLKAGDIIATESIAYGMLHWSAQYTRCCFCFKTAMSNLISCLKCASLMFCSEECRDKTYEKCDDVNEMLKFDYYLAFNYQYGLAFGDEACGSRTKLKLFVKENNINALTTNIFDCDFSEGPDSQEYKKNMLKCILSLEKTPRKGLYDMIDHEPTHFAEDPSTLKFLRRFLAVLIGNTTTRRNNFEGYGEVIEGCFIHPLLRLFKHACTNNVSRFWTDTKMFYFAALPVKAGDELTVNMLGAIGNPCAYDTEKRKIGLKSRNIPDCNCFYCANDIDYSKLKKTDPDEFWAEHFEIPYDILETKSFKATFGRLNKFWELITEASDDPSSYRVAKLKRIIDDMLSRTASLVSYPCVPTDYYV